jgi:hypothetical protein
MICQATAPVCTHRASHRTLPDSVDGRRWYYCLAHLDEAIRIFAQRDTLLSGSLEPVPVSYDFKEGDHVAPRANLPWRFGRVEEVRSVGRQRVLVRPTINSSATARPAATVLFAFDELDLLEFTDVSP